jgi:hypothetical protein
MMVTGINETVMLANMKLHSVLSIAAVALLSIFAGAVRSNEAIITSEGLLAPPKSMRSIIDATQREQRHGSA